MVSGTSSSSSKLTMMALKLTNLLIVQIVSVLAKSSPKQHQNTPERTGKTHDTTLSSELKGVKFLKFGALRKKMKQHLYEQLAYKCVARVVGAKFRLLPEDWRECQREAVAQMCVYASKRPHLSENRKYMFVVGCCRIREFLFGKHGKPNMSVLKNGNCQFEKVEGWLLKPDSKYQSDDFCDKNAHLIFSFLLDLRSKKGARGQAASLRDMQIIKLAALGWSNSEIGDELGIPADHIKKYRQQIKRRLEDALARI